MIPLSSLNNPHEAIVMSKKLRKFPSATLICADSGDFQACIAQADQTIAPRNRNPIENDFPRSAVAVEVLLLHGGKSSQPSCQNNLRDDSSYCVMPVARGNSVKLI